MDRDKYWDIRRKIFNTSKPTRLGWEWIELCDRGQFTMGYCWDYLILFGAQTFAGNNKPKRYEMMRVVTQCIHGSGRVVVLDQGGSIQIVFPSSYFCVLEDCYLQTPTKL